MKKIIYGVKFIWISIGNLDPTIIFVILEWLLLVYWSRSISLVFLRGSPLDRRNSYRHWWWTIQWKVYASDINRIFRLGANSKVYASDGNQYFGFWRAFRDRKHNYRPTEARPLSSTDGLNSGLRENPNCHFQTENIQIFWKFSIIRISISFWIFIEDFAYYFTTNRTFLVG